MDEASTLEILPPETNGALQALETASIDMQIATAKKYPRDLAKVKSRMLSYATLDEDTAEACFYTLKRKDKQGKEKLIQGPSIRLAEIAASSFGNIRSGARVLSNNGKVIVCQGVSHDVENNVYYSGEVTRRITTNSGKTYGDDMQAVTANAGCAIALRNAITKVVPLALIKPVLEAAMKVAVGDVKSLSAKRDKVITRLKQMGANQDAILAAVDCSTVEEVTTDKLQTLIGLGTALKEGDTSLEEAFPHVGGKLHSAGTKEKEPEAAPTPTPTPENTPAPPPTPETKHVTGQQALLEFITSNGYNFTELVCFLMDGGYILDANGKQGKKPNSIDDIPIKLVETLLKSPTGLLMGLKKWKVT